MTHDDIAQLLDYHYWALHRVLDAVAPLTPAQYTRDLGGSFPSIRATLIHLYGAEWVWQQRWNGASPSALPREDAWPELQPLRAAWAELESGIRDALTRIASGGLETLCHYRNLAGAAHQSTHSEIVQHLVNHGSYHRGQIATYLRQLGGAPPQSMDLIQFFRERRR